MRSKTLSEHEKRTRSRLAAALGRCKRGVIEQKSTVKAISARKAIEVGNAVRDGNLGRAAELRALYFPALVARRAMEAKMRGENPSP